MTFSSPLSQSLNALFKSRSIHAWEMNLVVDNAICPSQEFVDEVLLHVNTDDDSSSCCNLDDSFARILSTNNSLDEQEDDILSLGGGGEDSYRDCRWDETTAAEVTKNTSLMVPPCRCPPTPSSKTTTPKMPKRKISKAAIRNWMLQMPTEDGTGHTFTKKNVADIVKEAEELVRTLLLDSPDGASTISPVVFLNTVRINEIASKSA
jgi:hypothetical protein